MQGGLVTHASAHSPSALWTAHYRATVEAVNPQDSPPTVDVVLLRYNTRFAHVPVARSPFVQSLPQVGETVSVYMAEGVRDNAWVAQDLPRSDTADPLFDAKAWRFLHPSGVMLQVDPDGTVLALYPSGATLSLAGQAHTEIATTHFRVSGGQASGTATFTGTAGTQIPTGLPLTGGGYLFYTTGSATIPSTGSVTVPFVAAVGGTGPNGVTVNALSFPFTGIASVSGTASGGTQATDVTLDAASISLGGTHAVARVGDSIQVTVGGTVYTGQITTGSSVVTAG